MFIDVMIKKPNGQSVVLKGLTGEEVLTLTRLVFAKSQYEILISQSQKGKKRAELNKDWK